MSNQRFCSIFCISTGVLPFVSGMIIATIAAPHMQMPANKNAQTCRPNASFMNGKHLSMVNARNANNEMQNNVPMSFSFSGSTSDMIRNGSDITPQLAKKTIIENALIGSQLRALISKSSTSSVRYVPIIICASAVPTADIMIKY